MSAFSSFGIRSVCVGMLCGVAMFSGAFPAHAEGWVALSSPVTVQMFGMDCGSATSCVQVGFEGTVIYTSDGVTWTEGVSGVTEALAGVDMYSSTTGFAVGMGGTILKTTDGGATWSRTTGVTTELLTDVIMTSTSIAYIAGENGAVFKTTDGGTSWTDISAGLSGMDAYTIDAYSASVVYVAGDAGAVYKTTNGGTSWTALTSGTTQVIYALDVISASVAYIGGADAFLAATTNGATFSAQTLSSFESTEAVTDLACVTTSVCLASGSLGAVEYTTDSGTTWTEQVMPGTEILGGVSMYAVGQQFVGGGNGALYYRDVQGPNAVTDLALSSGGTSTTDTTPAFKWDAAVDETSSVTSYAIDIDDTGTWTNIGDVTTYTVASALAVGSHTISVIGIDDVDNDGDAASFTFTVTEASSDTTAPTVGTVTPTSATQDTATTYTVTATDDEGVYACYLVVDGADQGMMTAGSSSTYTKSYTSAVSGEIDVSVWCGDTSANIGTGSVVTVTVAAAAETDTDTTNPTVGAITPLTATEGTALTLSASVADSGGLDTCVLYVEGTYIGAMTISGGYASRSYTFDDSGDMIANAYCTDDAGNSTRGATSTIAVAAASGAATEEESTAVSEADEGSLIKLACGSNADVEDPCHAVYYFDGKRHAFPNEKVFFTWYENFDDIVIVTDSYMASITLGKNVTYHPGTRMVKFVTVNTVYGVGETGELRAIASEEVAKSIWGSAWNTLIDDISDAFYGNYRFGEAIDSTSDFDPEEVEASVTDILDILE